MDSGIDGTGLMGGVEADFQDTDPVLLLLTLKPAAGPPALFRVVSPLLLLWIGAESADSGMGVLMSLRPRAIAGLAIEPTAVACIKAAAICFAFSSTGGRAIDAGACDSDAGAATGAGASASAGAGADADASGTTAVATTCAGAGDVARDSTDAASG